jgi:hypothetical protein
MPALVAGVLAIAVALACRLALTALRAGHG